jgi:D-alanyl-D-alanine carboxypeptidase
VPGLTEAFERIGDAAEQHLPLTHAPGVALAVTDREAVLGVVVRGFADVAAQLPVRPETRFEIGSISKQFAATVCLQEVESGRLDLHVSVNELLPWLDLPEPFGPITLHHLLTHTSGLPIGTEESPTGPGAIAILRTLGPTFAPGERFFYSNDGYKLVGAVLEGLTGRPMHELLRERILGPLGMRSSEGAITNATRLDLAVGYGPVFDDRPPHLNHPLAPGRWIVSGTADGAIVSNVVDMSAWARMLLGRGCATVNGTEVRLLSEEMFALMTTPHAETDDPAFRYGYGLDIATQDGRGVVAHAGGMISHTALLVVDLTSGLAAVALQNGEGDKARLVDAALAAVRAAIAGEPITTVSFSAPTAIPNASELAGTYSGERTIELRSTDDGLRLVDGALGVVLERWPDAEDAFLVPTPAWDRYLLRVLRDDDGVIAELVHGQDRFAPAGRDLSPSIEYPAIWEAFPGVYRSNDPWEPVTRIFLRAGKLWLCWPFEGIEQELVPLEDGVFGVGDPRLPRRVRFDDVLDGRAAVLHYNGGRWFRSFEE